MGDPDMMLVKQCRAGNRAGLEALYRRHADRVWRYGWFVTQSKESASEILQETFLRVVQSIGRFKGRSRFSTWLFAVMRSAAMDHLRQGRRETNETDLNDDEPVILKLESLSGATPLGRKLVADDEVGSNEISGSVGSSGGLRADDGGARQQVRDAVAGLPPQQQDAVILCELLELETKEVAEILNWSESRVRTTLCRARRSLRDALERNETRESSREKNRGV